MQQRNVIAIDLAKNSFQVCVIGMTASFYLVPVGG